MHRAFHGNKFIKFVRAWILLANGNTERTVRCCVCTLRHSHKKSFCVRGRIEKIVHCTSLVLSSTSLPKIVPILSPLLNNKSIINYSLFQWYCTRTRRAPIVNKMGARHQGQDYWMGCHPSIENYASVTDISFVRDSLTKISSSMYKCMKYNLISALDIALLDYGLRFACFQIHRETIPCPVWKFSKLSSYFSMCRMSINVAKWTFLSFSCASFMTSSLESLHGQWISLRKCRESCTRIS